MRDHLEQGLLELDAIIFGQEATRIPNTSYFSLPNIEGDTLVVRLNKLGFAVASGAACSSVKPGQSHVLEAMKIDPLQARGAVRVSLGRSNTLEQVNEFIQATRQIEGELNNLSSMSR